MVAAFLMGLHHGAHVALLDKFFLISMVVGPFEGGFPIGSNLLLAVLLPDLFTGNYIKQL